MITACHNCEYNGSGDPRCISCKRVDQDDIRIYKTPHANNESLQDGEAKYYVVRSTPRPYTQKAEKTLEMLNEVTSLTLPEFVILMHLARRGRSRDAGAALRRFAEEVRSFKPSTTRGRKTEKITRACIVMKKKALAERYPIVAALSRLYGHGIGWGDHE